MAVAAAVAGCGGGGDSTTGAGGDTTSTAGGESSEASGPAPTKAAFIKEADAICQKADGELTEEVVAYAKAHNIDTGKEPTEPQLEEIYKEVVLPNIGKQGEAIASLTPPEGDEEVVDSIVEALESGVEEGQANPSELVEGKNPVADASAKAKAYGFKACGSGG
ncbi:MAG: hypothetical protein JST31_07750 [Actinobacteria bacterium]|nr:hypothetical protein [Actinomycetota bacterium]